jgi:hypothetical protein
VEHIGSVKMRSLSGSSSVLRQGKQYLCMQRTWATDAAGISGVQHVAQVNIASEAKELADDVEADFVLLVLVEGSAAAASSRSGNLSMAGDGVAGALGCVDAVFWVSGASEVDSDCSAGEEFGVFSVADSGLSMVGSVGVSLISGSREDALRIIVVYEPQCVNTARGRCLEKSCHRIF